MAAHAKHINTDFILYTSLGIRVVIGRPRPNILILMSYFTPALGYAWYTLIVYHPYLLSEEFQLLGWNFVIVTNEIRMGLNKIAPEMSHQQSRTWVVSSVGGTPCNEVS